MGELSNGPIPDPHAPQTEGLQIGDPRLSISCAVVERLDHHYGDDIVVWVITDKVGESNNLPECILTEIDWDI